MTKPNPDRYEGVAGLGWSLESILLFTMEPGQGTEAKKGWGAFARLQIWWCPGCPLLHQEVKHPGHRWSQGGGMWSKCRPSLCLPYPRGARSPGVDLPSLSSLNPSLYLSVSLSTTVSPFSVWFYMLPLPTFLRVLRFSHVCMFTRVSFIHPSVLMLYSTPLHYCVIYICFSRISLGQARGG